jgi:nicotinate-nucleotide adenylyltransferase
MNIAVFGGSFDPPHIGHEEIIKKTIQNLDIDRLFVVPTFLNPFKFLSFTPAKKRATWIETLIKKYQKAEVLNYEIEQNRPIPTIETIKYIEKKYKPKKIYLIIGADNVETLHLWKDFKELEKMVKFVIASRDDIKIPKNLKKLDICVNISSTDLRENLKQEYLPKSIAKDVINYYKRSKMNNRIEMIVNLLDEKKAENIQLFDMREKDYIVDDVVIATTINSKHGLALFDYLKDELKKNGESHIQVEPSDDWIVIDLGDTLIHLMSSEYRTKYNIEEFLQERTKQNINQDLS